MESDAEGVLGKEGMGDEGRAKGMFSGVRACMLWLVQVSDGLWPPRLCRQDGSQATNGRGGAWVELGRGMGEEGIKLSSPPCIERNTNSYLVSQIIST